jgi:hypothetical protein
MEWLWTWGGTCFGYRVDNQLWTHDGKHVGNFQGDEIFGSNGRYLGEIMNGNRLIKCLNKRNQQGYSFTPYGRRAAYVKFVNYVGYVMYAGYEDFDDPSSF